MIASLLAALALLLAGIYAYLRPGWRRTGPYLPDSFVAGLALFAVGATINSWQASSDAASEVAMMGWLALCSGLLGAMLGAVAVRPRTSFAEFVAGAQASQRAERFVIRTGLVISSLACIAFIYAVLSTAPITALLSIASVVKDSSLLAVRKMITAGTDGYFAPGYVKQFRDILIPILLSALIASNPKFRESWFFWAIVIVTVVAMLLTGQRFIIVVSAGTLLLASYYAVGLRMRSVLIAGTATIVAFGVVTILLGRVEKQTTLEAVAAVAENLGDRIVLTVPRENTLTYPVWHSLGPTMGGSWLDDASGILPGPHRQHLSNLLHATAGGSEEGNSPLALPVDAWLAWGWAGVALCPILFALGLAFLDRMTLSRKSPISLGLKMYLFLVVPVFYSPYLFVLYGGAVAIFLLTLVQFSRPAGSRLRPSASAMARA